jgi:beta-glucanase (GH16 family)
MIDGDGLARGTYHWSAPYVFNHSNCSSGDHQRPGHKRMPEDWNTAYHEYAVEYGPTHVAFAVDGEVVTNTTAEQLTLDGRARIYPVPYYFILNTAVHDGKTEPGWVHGVTAETTMPIYHKIDYVRVVKPA